MGLHYVFLFAVRVAPVLYKLYTHCRFSKLQTERLFMREGCLSLVICPGTHLSVWVSFVTFNLLPNIHSVVCCCTFAVRWHSVFSSWEKVVAGSCEQHLHSCSRWWLCDHLSDYYVYYSDHWSVCHLCMRKDMTLLTRHTLDDQWTNVLVSYTGNYIYISREQWVSTEGRLTSVLAKSKPETPW